MECLSCRTESSRNAYQADLARRNAPWITRYSAELTAETPNKGDPLTIAAASGNGHGGGDARRLRADGDADVEPGEYLNDFVVPPCGRCGGVMKVNRTAVVGRGGGRRQYRMCLCARKCLCACVRAGMHVKSISEPFMFRCKAAQAQVIRTLQVVKTPRVTSTRALDHALVCRNQMVVGFASNKFIGSVITASTNVDRRSRGDPQPGRAVTSVSTEM